MRKRIFACLTAVGLFLTVYAGIRANAEVITTASYPRYQFSCTTNGCYRYENSTGHVEVMFLGLLNLGHNQEWRK